MLLEALCHLYLSSLIFMTWKWGLFPLGGWELLEDYAPVVSGLQYWLGKRAPPVNMNFPRWEGGGGPRGPSPAPLEAEPGRAPLGGGKLSACHPLPTFSWGPHCVQHKAQPPVPGTPS